MPVWVVETTRLQEGGLGQYFFYTALRPKNWNLLEAEDIAKEGEGMASMLHLPCRNRSKASWAS